ncbi:MAG: hypothetical protein JJ854_02195 [Pseudomonadales bacterium]|nr:hypothetical protein [Pseudomonadales bacterium]
MRHLPLTSNGYKKPWFVKANDIRVPDEKKYVQSMTKGKCWICGGTNKKEQVFVTDPKSASLGVSLEPPCHPACAEYSAMVCPFLILPKAKRREAGLPENYHENNQAPEASTQNPGEIILTYVKKHRFEAVTKTKMARWEPSQILRQSLWKEGQIIADNPNGPLPANLLADAVRRTTS